MDTVFAHGRIADFLAAIMLVEALILACTHAITGRGLPPSRLIPMLCAGAFLVLALRAALTDAPLVLVIAAVACAGIAHAFDLTLRLKDRYGPPPCTGRRGRDFRRAGNERT